ISGASTVLSLPYPTTDYDSQTRAKLIKRSTKVLQRLNETLKNADLYENFCACSKLFFWTSVLRRSPTITDDYSVHQILHNALLVLYQRPWTITNVSSNVIETLTRTLWCDGEIRREHV